MECEATQHAYKRAKERLKWKPKTLDRMMDLAMEKGICHKDTTGRLNKYLFKLWRRNRSVNNIRIYGENVYFFSKNRLITIYRLPTELIKYLKNVKTQNNDHE